MKIAYILYPEVIISNRTNGIRSQAENWARGVRCLGHQVDLINEWGDYTWGDYDIIHIFGDMGWAVPQRLSKLNLNLCLSPICDPGIEDNPSKIRMKLRILECLRPLVVSHTYLQHTCFSYYKRIFVRTQYEGSFIAACHGFDKDRFSVVPLSYSSQYEGAYTEVEKEPFCFHVSSVYQPRKNVVRLIEAAKKYEFELYLAGNKGSDSQFKPIADAIGGAKNIHVLGLVSEERKIDLYRRAKVFALPSVQEGVGIVALDAAVFGDEIVMTDIGGPKEYYNGLCSTVNPMDVDSIGSAVRDFLDGKIRFQPATRQYIETNFSPAGIAEKLIVEYKKILAE